MITYLTNLKSTNNSRGSHVHVTVGVDGQQTTAALGFLIHGKIYRVDVNLAPHQPHEISLSHTETGRCWVAVIDTETRVSTGRFLNLDEPES